MSYRSRLYNHRNATGLDVMDKKPFFSRKSNDTKNSFFQAKYENSNSTNPAEVQANSVAGNVVSRKMNAAPINAVSQNSLSHASPQLASRISQSAGKGKQLPENTLRKMNGAFNADFRNVKIHHDAEAAEMNGALHAQAFTHKNDIYFNAGKYDTQSSTGQELIAHELTHVVQQGHQQAPGISRKISVGNPTQPIPNPTGKGITESNIEAVLDYISELCPDAALMTSGGDIILVDTGFCFPGVPEADGTFVSPASLSPHPVSCECICEMIMNPLENIVIFIDDTSAGNASTSSTPSGAVIRVPSPNVSGKPVRGASGKTISSPNFIILGHELCGHHFLTRRGSDEQEKTQNYGRGAHDSAIERENMMRAEHGLDLRATFRDPCCGLSTSTDQDLKKKSGICGDEFEKAKNIKGTDAYECKHWREEYNKLNGTNFTTDDQIPEDPFETVPAEWRIEVLFNKDAPQSWQGLKESLSADGKDALEVVVILLKKHPEFKAQLAGNASSDRPANDPDYNSRLAKRRAQLVFDELTQQKIDKERIVTFDSDCQKIREGVHNCSDSVSEKKTNALDRNVEVKLF